MKKSAFGITNMDDINNSIPEDILQLFDNLEEFAGDINKACKYVKVEERKNKKLLDQNHDRIGKIISCHLVLEHFINRELELLNNISYQQRKDARLTFYSKVKMLPKTGMLYSPLIKAIIKVNTLRNMYAHNLNYEITETQMKEIDRWVEKIPNSNFSKLNKIERIEKFAQFCILVFSFRSDTSFGQFKNLHKKYPDIPIFGEFLK